VTTKSKDWNSGQWGSDFIGTCHPDLFISQSLIGKLVMHASFVSL
jgi:hypothetical protein